MLKLTTISYGIAIVIISALFHYVVQSGVDRCNSMAGIVSQYTSKDYDNGCKALFNIQLGSLFSGLTGAGIIISGILRNPKIR